MSKNKIEVNMNVYDIPIVIEELEKAQDTIKKLQQEKQQLENNRNKAVREIMHMIEEGNITFFKGKKLENILMGDSHD